MLIDMMIDACYAIPRGFEYSAYWNSNRDGMRYKPIGARTAHEFNMAPIKPYRL